jgi:hypothetical protein
MSSDPGFTMFRKFSYLHIRQLLFMQEELTLLERRLYDIDVAEAGEVNPMTRRCDNNAERRSIMADIKIKLREYGLAGVSHMSIVTADAIG